MAHGGQASLSFLTPSCPNSNKFAILSKLEQIRFPSGGFIENEREGEVTMSVHESHHPPSATNLAVDTPLPTSPFHLTRGRFVHLERLLHSGESSVMVEAPHAAVERRVYICQTQRVRNQRECLDSVSYGLRSIGGSSCECSHSRKSFVFQFC